MRYIARAPYMGSFPQLEISEGRYNVLLAAFNHIAALASVEEKYDILLANYQEYESEMLGIALDDEIHSEFSVVAFSSLYRQIARRFVNLLSAARLYLDFVGAQCKDALGEWGEVILARVHFLYDNESDYRLIEALRNHVQHKGLPFSFSRHGAKLDFAGTFHLVFHTSAYLRKDQVLGDDSIKSIVKDDLRRIASDSIELDAPLKHYIEMLSEIHNEIRTTTSARTSEAESRISSIMDEYALLSDTFGKSEQKVLGLYEWEEAQSLPHASVEIHTNGLTNLKYMSGKNPLLRNLRRRYVSGLSGREIDALQKGLENLGQAPLSSATT